MKILALTAIKKRIIILLPQLIGISPICYTHKNFCVKDRLAEELAGGDNIMNDTLCAFIATGCRFFYA